MQAVAMEEPPSILWGLDPIFCAFARLYIKDILQMTESVQVPGIYFYNSHPIYKVDVLGTVVYKRERDDFFCYGVDDGTGVINCLCWKSELFKDKDDGAGASAPGPSDQGGFDPVAELKKLKEAHQKRCCLEIGELIRVRGPVKTFRQQREISASVFYKVEDPLMAVQIQWMMDVPELYRECYDRTFQLQSEKQRESPDSPLIKATNLIKDFIKQKSVSKFRPYDVQDLLQPLILSQPQAASADPVRQNTAETFSASCLVARVLVSCAGGQCSAGNWLAAEAAVLIGRTSVSSSSGSCLRTESGASSGHISRSFRKRLRRGVNDVRPEKMRLAPARLSGCLRRTSALAWRGKLVEDE